MKPSHLSNLDGLLDLSRRNGVDVRPTLARVLTDLYVQKLSHTVEEERHYSELLGRLIEHADTAARAVIATKLANYPAAPLALLLRLAQDEIEVAEPVLRCSSALSDTHLDIIARNTGARHAAVIAQRRGQTPDVDTQTLVGPALPDAAPEAFTSAPAHTQTGQFALADVFAAMSSEERRHLLASLDDITPLAEPNTLPAAAATVINRLEVAALGRKPELFLRELETALNLSFEDARRIVEDDTGELILIAAKCLGMPQDVLMRVLLFLNPVIGQSVARVFELAKLYGEIRREVALRLIIARDPDQAGSRTSLSRHSTARGGAPLRDSPRPDRTSAPANPVRIGFAAPETGGAIAAQRKS